MALSVRLEPAIEARLEEEARRLGISKSQFVKDALERTLGLKNPAVLLAKVRSGTPMGNKAASQNVAANIRKKLCAKHSG